METDQARAHMRDGNLPYLQSWFEFGARTVPHRAVIKGGSKRLPPEMPRDSRRVWLRLWSVILVLVWWTVPMAVSAHLPFSATQRDAVRVPILVYHAVDDSGNTYSVTPQQLNEQCRWLVANGYTAITLQQFWRAVRGNTALPPYPIVLTNDDGDTSVMRFAAILRRYGLVGNYFVNNVSLLTQNQIRSLARSGTVEAHAVSHIALSGLDYEDQVTEIAENRTYLEHITGHPVRFLAWPYGDTDKSAIEAATASGIVAAFGLGGTAATLDPIDPYTIPRIAILVEDDLTTFAAKVSGEATGG